MKTFVSLAASALVFACVGARAAAVTPLPPSLQGVQRLLFLGDSLTDGSSYPDYVVNSANAACGAKIELLNAGICGDTAAMLLARLKDDVLDRKPDMVIVCIGTNDCEENHLVVQFKADIGKLVDTMLAAKIRVALMLPSPLGKAGMETRFESYLDAIKGVAADRKVTLIDAHGEFQRQIAAGKDMLGPDGIHHGKDGFAGMARAVLDGLGLTGVAVDTTIPRSPNMVGPWEISAPIAADAKTILTLDPNVSTGWKAFDANAAAAALAWNDVPFVQRGAVMPLALEKPAKPAAAFARCTFQAAKASKAQLQLGGSPPLVVWLNHKEVWRSNKAHGYHVNADRLTVDLAPGQNSVVVLTNLMAFVAIVPE